ncbi:FMN-binding protein [Clostridium sp. JN-9]|uniref:FMN-binding protein n=1 Tax=Clostridium sp. JN-9 TaxID=2507159 RepID=UPI000FFE231F|nr:FMN-binding protein [Clostridium sp. JN-9]QAT40407.1 FMN-binding protein [Clostridium sp. JN-9]
MNRKRILAMVAAATLTFTILSGCGSKSTTQTSTTAGKYKDGTYKAAYDKFDGHGWKAQVSIDVKDGKIATVNFDYVDKDGKLKSKNTGYETAMKKVNKVGPAEYTVTLDKALVEKQDISKVEAVTGATESSNNFKKLSTAALDNSAKGDTKDAVVRLYKDGTYKAEYKDFDSHGWKEQFEVVIKDGSIASSKFDAVNKDGKLKTQDAGYEESMKKVTKIGPVEYSDMLSKVLPEKQNIGEAPATLTGATESLADFKSLAASALDNAAQGKTETALLDLPKPAK